MPCPTKAGLIMKVRLCASSSAAAGYALFSDSGTRVSTLNINPAMVVPVFVKRGGLNALIVQSTRSARTESNEKPPFAMIVIPISADSWILYTVMYA